MKIIACCKAAPEEQDIVVKSDGTLSFDRAVWKFGSYDLNAVEAGRVLADEAGGELIGLSVGTSELANTKLRKDILSRGLDQLVVVADDELGSLDSFQTAQQLKASIEQLGGFDLILCGAGSSDLYSQIGRAHV
jgi:electron transfer flavoprotein beta subunit